jgi:hypothetical protein
MDGVLTWLFWSFAAVIGYSYIGGFIKYLHHLRRGSRILATQALLQSMLSMFVLVALWLIHWYYPLV